MWTFHIFFQPRLREQAWSHSKVWAKHVQTVLQTIRRRNWLQKGNCLFFIVQLILCKNCIETCMVKVYLKQGTYMKMNNLLHFSWTNRNSCTRNVRSRIGWPIKKDMKTNEH